MLLRLRIDQFATVESLELRLDGGLTVLTGETGAGKSILFDALDLLFGARAEAGQVRTDAARSELEAEVALPDTSPVLEWLQEQDLADPDTPQILLLRRTLRADGGSKAWVNGRQVTLGSLRELAELVLDIHGQHAHQALLRPHQQRALIDEFGRLDAQREQMRRAWTARQRALQELDSLRSAALSAPAQRELLQYQCDELEQFAPQPDEWEALSAEFLRLNRIDELRADCAQALDLLDNEDHGVESTLARAIRCCEGALEALPNLTDVHAALLQAQAATVEARRDLGHQAEALESDPERLAQVSARLDQWESLARKHRCAPAALLAHWEQLSAQLQQAAGEDQQRASLEAAVAKHAAECQHAAQILSAARRRTADDLVKEVLQRLPELGLPHAQMQIEIASESDEPGPEGVDRVSILVSLNPGQALAPLAKVASGGELARISLAFAVSNQSRSAVPILLFDEVDVGVGGAIAEAIGEHLLALARQNQVLCVTHQPQVAALARTHLHVLKHVRAERTYSEIQILDDDARVEELSRMAGGRAITEQTRAHARSLLESGAVRRA